MSKVQQMGTFYKYTASILKKNWLCHSSKMKFLVASRQSHFMIGKIVKCMWLIMAILSRFHSFPCHCFPGNSWRNSNLWKTSLASLKPLLPLWLSPVSWDYLTSTTLVWLASQAYLSNTELTFYWLRDLPSGSNSDRETQRRHIGQLESHSRQESQLQTQRTKMFVHLSFSKYGKIPYFLPPWQP